MRPRQSNIKGTTCTRAVHTSSRLRRLRGRRARRDAVHLHASLGILTPPLLRHEHIEADEPEHTQTRGKVPLVARAGSCEGAPQVTCTRKQQPQNIDKPAVMAAHAATQEERVRGGTCTHKGIQAHPHEHKHTETCRLQHRDTSDRATKRRREGDTPPRSCSRVRGRSRTASAWARVMQNHWSDLQMAFAGTTSARSARTQHARTHAAVASRLCVCLRV